jgi:2-polyprenyl-3-methyl-5-hydroxy-6-metoxy-1,4-benzoquinol methylase
MKKNTDLKAFYDGIYRKGEKEHYTYFRLQQGGMPEEFAAVFALMSWEDKDIMDAGCGTGDMCAMIANAGAKSVLGVDFAESAIAEANKKYQAPNLEYKCINVDEIDKTFDVIISNGTLEHMDEPLETLQSWKKKLNPGGSLILTCPNWLNPRGYMLQTLWHLFRAPITLADLHYLTPITFEEWAKTLEMDLDWSTVDHEWGGGMKMVEDFKKRLPNVARDAKWDIPQEQIDNMLSWLETYSVPFLPNAKHEGAVGVYHLKLS